MESISIYIHWPFCLKKCPYCDFNSHVANYDIDHLEWFNAFNQEIENFSIYLYGKNIKSIFFGGGTPSLMSPTLVAKILKKLQEKTAFKEGIEITLEANPTSFEQKKFQDFKKAGINRVSLGAQSFNAQNLKFLGREHSNREAIIAIENAANIFNNFSFDIIYCLPNQKLSLWLKELEFIVKLAKFHLSLYQLTIEKGTKFFAQHLRNEFQMPSNELSADFFEATNEILVNNNFRQYEVSNYSIPGYECVHNLNYWQYGEFLGLGPGAHSRIFHNNEMCSFYNFYQPEIWKKNLLTNISGIQNFNILNEKSILEEFIMMGLRTVYGINKQRLKKFSVFQNIEKKIKILLDNELLYEKNNHLIVRNFLSLDNLTAFILT